MNWSAKQYSKFEQERTRAVRDLLGALPQNEVETAIDIGCGPGNSTEVLVDLFPEASVSAFDSSRDMIEAARKRLPQVQFSVRDIYRWEAPGPFGLILANAVMQWLPEHDIVFPALINKLEYGGSLAIQMPDNLDEPAHRLMREIAYDDRWADKLSYAIQARTARYDANWYYQLLSRHASKTDIWRTTYYHALPGGAESVVEWFKGSGLRPFLALLNESEQQKFLAKYLAAIKEAYPAQPDGTVLLPFPRLFMIATR